MPAHPSRTARPVVSQHGEPTPAPASGVRSHAAGDRAPARIARSLHAVAHCPVRCLPAVDATRRARDANARLPAGGSHSAISVCGVRARPPYARIASEVQEKPANQLPSIFLPFRACVSLRSVFGTEDFKGRLYVLLSDDQVDGRDLLPHRHGSADDRGGNAVRAQRALGKFRMDQCGEATDDDGPRCHGDAVRGTRATEGRSRPATCVPSTSLTSVMVKFVPVINREPRPGGRRRKTADPIRAH